MCAVCAGDGEPNSASLPTVLPKPPSAPPRPTGTDLIRKLIHLRAPAGNSRQILAQLSGDRGRLTFIFSSRFFSPQRRPKVICLWQQEVRTIKSGTLLGKRRAIIRRTLSCFSLMTRLFLEFSLVLVAVSDLKSTPNIG